MYCVEYNNSIYLYFTRCKMEDLIRRHISLIEETSMVFQRYLIKSLPWNERLVGIKGSRGVGKTTLMLQYIKSKYGISSKALYVSLDNIYFAENKLIFFVDDFVSKGGEHLFIDEVHKYNNWSIELKNIYDNHPNLKLTFTGSSLLEILNSRADLSRRALIYNMQGLSFREFLIYKHNFSFDTYSVDDIINNHTDIAIKINKDIKPLEYFDEYLKFGYFPFYKDNGAIYYKKLQEIINMILEIELPLLRNTDISIIYKIKQLLYIISQSVPFKPNISALANKIKTTRKTVLDYINYLHEADILNLIHKDVYGVSLLQKPEKLFFNNTNYMYSILGVNPNVGNIRETFFLNQISENHVVTYPEKGDFLVDDLLLFEIGGKDKSTKQIVDFQNSFVVADDINFGYENKIPLWLFGFLY